MQDWPPCQCPRNVRDMVRTSAPLRDLIVLPLVLLAAATLWLAHANAWDLGGRSPILNFDTSQYAVAARELAQRGTLSTPFALPIELVHNPSPPWPLAVVQPGVVLVNAALFALVPNEWVPGAELRAALTLLLPFACFLMLAASLALAVRHLFARWWPESPAWTRLGAALTLSLAFVLDPEAQHFAMGGFTELPFTLGLFFGLFGLAMGGADKRPFTFGLLLGVAGLFRANMLWLVPIFTLAAAWSSASGGRRRIVLLILLGFALPLSPWWFYKWTQFGSPAWDLTRFVVFDRVAGFDWFMLYHRPEVPDLPTGFEAVRLLSAKTLANLPTMLTSLTLGPRGLWLGALVVWLFTRPPRPLAAAGIAVIGISLLGVLTASVSIPWLRYLFPSRILLEPAGVLAMWALIWRADSILGSPRSRAITCVLVAALSLGWGAWSTSQGLHEARETSRVRGVPDWHTMSRIAVHISQRLGPDEPVMSNLGPTLAWRTRRPVIHLAHSPSDIASTRALCDFRHIILCFRNAERAWPAWQEIWVREGAAAATPGMQVVSEQRYQTNEGFTVVWIELAPRGPMMASATDETAESDPAQRVGVPTGTRGNQTAVGRTRSPAATSPRTTLATVRRPSIVKPVTTISAATSSSPPEIVPVTGSSSIRPVRQTVSRSPRTMPEARLMSSSTSP